MKKIIFIFTVFAAAIACNKVEQNFEAADNLVSMSFQASGTDFTKTSLSSDFSILWNSSDKITVFSGENFATSSEFAVQNVSQDMLLATFSGLAAVSPAYYAVFPASADATISAQGTVTATLPTVQNATAGSFGAEANLSVAYVAGSDELFFRNAGALLSVDIKAEDVTGIKIETLDGDPLTGTANISYNNGVPVATVTDGKNSVESTVAGAGVYYFVVYPGSFEQGFKITLTKDGCSASMTNTKALTIERNDNVELSTVAAEVPWISENQPAPSIEVVASATSVTLSEATKLEKALELSWTDASSDNVRQYEVEFAKASDTGFSAPIHTEIVCNTSVFFYQIDLELMLLNADITLGQETQLIYRIKSIPEAGDAEFGVSAIQNLSVTSYTRPVPAPDFVQSIYIAGSGVESKWSIPSDKGKFEETKPGIWEWTGTISDRGGTFKVLFNGGWKYGFRHGVNDYYWEDAQFVDNIGDNDYGVVLAKGTYKITVDVNKGTLSREII